MFQITSLRRYILLLFLIMIFLTFIVFFSSFLNLKYFWDDERFIFVNPEMLTLESWKLFWNPKYPSFKSWPLGYTIFWFLYRYLGIVSISTYKAINIFFHGFNAFCVYIVFKKLNIKSPFFFSLFFLIHPFHVETVSWIFQLFTILALTFFLISFIFYLKFVENNSFKYVFLFVFFLLLSLLVKPISILAPIPLFFLAKSKYQLKLKKIFIVFFLFSAILAGFSIIGAKRYLVKQETTRNDRVLNRVLGVIDQKLGDYREREKNTSRNFSIQKSESGNFLYKKNDIVENEIVFYKWDVFRQGIYFYFKNIVFPYDLTFIYKMKKYSSVFICIFLAGLVFGFNYLYMKSKDRLFIFTFLSFNCFLLPYLGFAYIPFFYWSNVSNRYTYFLVFFYSFFLALLYKNFDKIFTKKIFIGYLSYMLLSTYSFGLKFNSPKRLYKEAIENRPHPALYSLLFEQYYMDLDYIAASKVLMEGLKKFPQSEILKSEIIRLKTIEGVK